MRRVPFVLIVLLFLVSLTPWSSPRPSALAQDADPEATISALQTQVAELAPLAASATPEPSPESSQGPVNQNPTPSSDAVPLNDTFELLDYYFAEDNDSLYVFGEIRNFSDQPAAVPPIVFTFLDESGFSYGEEVIYPVAGWAPAGGRVPFQKLNLLGSVLRPGDWAEVNVTAGTPSLLPEGFDPLGIEIQDIPLEGPVAPLRGTIQNNYPEPIGPFSIEIAYYDSKGRFVGHCTGKYLDVTITPGRSVRLEIPAGGCGFHTIAKDAIGATGPFTYRLFV